METTTPSSAIPAAGKKGWAGLSTPVKVVIVVGGIVLLTAGGYVLFFRKKDGAGTKGESAKEKEAEKEKEAAGETSTSTDTSTGSGTTTTTPSGGASGGGTSSGRTMSASELPNGGKGCSAPRLTYDGDYDYVKCGGAWYTQSKPNPRTPAAKGKIPTWKNLSGNAVATSRLNSRYPTD